MTAYYEDDYCVECDDYGKCSGIPCSTHPLTTLDVKDMDEALHNGILWGDIFVIDEELRLEARTPEQVKAEDAKKKADDEKSKAGLRAYVLNKARTYHCEMIDGKAVLKHKFNTKCTDFGLEGGCWAHEEGICRFIHPGEESIYNFTSGKVLKLINGKPPRTIPFMGQISYLSNKTPIRPKPSSKIQDAW